MGLLSWYNAPFSLMILLSFGFLALQLLGGDSDSDLDADVDLDLDVDLDVDLAVDADVDVDLDLDVDLDSDVDVSGHNLFTDFLGIINLGGIPLSLLLMANSFSWGASGLILNSFIVSGFKTYNGLFFGVSLSLSFLLSLLSTRLFSKAFGAAFKESTATARPEELVGCVGRVLSGSVPEEGATQNGRANVYNSHGVLTRIQCVTHPEALAPQKNQTIFITGYDPERDRHTVLIHESDDFYAYLNGHRMLEARLNRSLASLKENTDQMEDR